ncbi:exodeoxyribonuclease V subunit beta [Bordetella sp. 15P40C-2]|uniref:UvrD-helicase domain-containing protein n=1 Tax=Bordetella sp. 15P40C-2 TaxID=2572246 RepID=UPI00132AA50B|nr:UvrD-helicase domain-containing protein [Bordetella sp. 15P40C-2]MVW71964.1 AAA family ATPase [Bordetella sp. 15P40C-2]
MSGSVRQPSDHLARARALNPAASYLVQAPAGSGKTELLTDRILALLATVNRPEEIVAITFTRKAASEMHARVLSKLRDGTGPMPETEHGQRSWQLARAALARDAELGWKLLQHPARLSIRTIDSFCAGLVRGMPWLSELGGMPSIADDAQAHYEAAARATVALVDEFDAVRTLLAHLDVDTQAAVEALAAMLGQRDQWLPLLAHGSDRMALEDALAEAIGEDLQALARAMPLGWHDALCGCARMAAATLDEEHPSHALSALRDWCDPLEPTAECLDQWKAVRHLLLTSSGGLRSSRGVNKKLGFPPKCGHKEPFTQWLDAADPAASWIWMLDAIDSVPPAEFSDAQWEVLSAQLMTLKLAVAQLHLRFAETREVDFIEIAQRASRALGSADDPGELLLKLDASIRHLLVDEFQDTSLTQIHLLATLTAGWLPGDGRTLFLVGDPMQSIYRFRKAEVGLFLQAAQYGIGEIEPEFLQLTDNFRSQAGVVEWVNATFRDLLPKRNDAAAGAIAYTASAAFNEALAGDAVRFHGAFSSVSASAADEAAETLTVKLVRQALRDRDPSSRHPVAILVRARGHLGQLVQRLTQAGIACRAVDLVPLGQRQVVSDLVQLARALAHPADRLAWLSVLRAPWCGLTLNSLHALFGHDLTTPIPALLADALRSRAEVAVSKPLPAVGQSLSLFDEPEPAVVPTASTSGAAETASTSMPSPSQAFDTAGGSCLAQRLLPADEYARLVHVADILLDTSNLSGAMPLAAWLESLWRKLGGAALYASATAADDAESLFALIERLAPHGALDPAKLDTALARLYAAPDGSDSEAGVVEIMTMHKSKGLQFDTVILYGLHKSPRADRAPLVSFEQTGERVLFGPVKPRADKEADPISRYLSLREKRRASYETDRLLYVAATRARHRLHLVGNVVVDPATGQPKPPSAQSLLGRLWDWLPPDQKAPPPGWQDEVAEEQNAATSRGGEPLRRVSNDAIARLRAQNPLRGSQSVSFGRLPSQQEQGAEHPAWQLENAHDAAIGTLAHAWLARIGQDGIAAWPAETLRAYLPIMQKQLTRAGLPAALAPDAAQSVLDTLLATLDHDRGRWLLSQSAARREWPLIDAAGRVSVIDLALSTEDGWLIVDYKTARPRPDESVAVFAARMRQRHADQLLRYCAQVTALDARPARAVLYFPRAALWIDLTAD